MGLISSPSVRMAHGAARPAWAMAAHVSYFASHTLRVGAGARPEMPVRAAGIVAGSSGSASRVVKCTNHVAT